MSSTPTVGISILGPGPLGTLRFLLASVVVLLHADLLIFASAQVAVLTFYFLSGFIMSFAFRRYQSRTFAGLRFFANRLLRLAPSFLIVATLTHLTLMNSSDQFAIRFSHIYLRDLLAYKEEGSFNSETFFAIDAQLSQGYFGFISEYVPQGWSIGNELTFYLTVPLLALMSLRAKWSLWALSLTLLMAQSAINFDDFDYFVYTNALATYFFFISGYLLPSMSKALTSRLKVLNQLPTNITKLWVTLMLAVAIFAPKLTSESLNPLITLSITFLLIIAISLYSLKSVEKPSPRDEFLGNLSYPLYISHIFVIGLTNALWEFSNLFIFSLIALIFSWVFSIVIYFIVEKPIELLRELIRQPSH